ncbi:MAG TPA: SpoIID/LytB domain-containing protein [Candidatus Bathyarchaeia archaeon]|nr:SpoIID/LytB domain-containing protein [Candidatus Bathyarchaeia archaeon]
MARLLKKIIKWFYILLTVLFFFLQVTSYLPWLHVGKLQVVYADELEDIARQIEELAKARQQSVDATKPLEEELDRLDAKLKSVQAGLKKAEENIVALEKSITQREKDFERQYVILAERVGSYYKNLRGPSKFLTLLSSQTASVLTKDLAYRQMMADEDKKIISNISQDLLTLENDKKKVEEDKIRLAELQTKTDEQVAFFQKEVKGAKDYQAQLSTKIAALTARQQQLLGQRLASLNLPTSLGAGPLYCVDDRKLDPGFSQAFAFFTYGIPHRVGMNQYGAYGRAMAGQDYHTILQAYFNATFEKRDPNTTIKVQGNGAMSLEEYTKRIYEVPDSWPMEALKAQAVAARSYVLAYTNNGQGEICTTQACQVFKPEPKGGNWEQAVNATGGEIMVSGGQVIKAWYSSTDGGYTFTSGDVWEGNKPWTKRLRDTNGEVASFADLQAKSYDRESPCFYSAQGARSAYAKSAWLKQTEVADIVNVLMLVKADDLVSDHLYQTDKPHPFGGEVWNEEKVKSELKSRGLKPFSNISTISVGWDSGIGKTTSIAVSGDGGSQNFSGDEFKNYFNLRAPANIQIVGPLYNVERR